jgi:hypothetical protein
MMLLVATLVAGAPAHAVLSSNYIFSTSSGTYSPLTAGTIVISGSNGGGVGTFNDLATSGTINIGFNFTFDCTVYTQFSVNPSGVLVLGNGSTTSYNDDLTAAATYPIIAPFWQHGHMYDNGGIANGCPMNPVIGVSYALSGSAPNRVLTVDWHTQLCDANGSYWWAGCGAPMNTFQLRLYETSNRIEFQYGSVWTSSGQPTSASIGIAGGSGNYISCTPSGGSSATASSVSNDNNIRLDLTPINSGTIYAFTPCQFTITGLTGQVNGGTAQMVAGDTLLAKDTVATGNFVVRTPYTFSLSGAGCSNKAYTMTISGPAAADYTFVQSGNQALSGSLNAGESITPQIKFTPSIGGRRMATLTLNDGCSSINYLLYSFGARPELQFRVGNAILDTNSGLFGGQTTCVAESPLTIPIDVINSGGAPVHITGFEMYSVDTAYAQGRPAYPYIRNANGSIAGSNEYYITTQPFVTPTSANPPTVVPINVPVGGTTIYVTFLPTLPGKRSAQLYIKTDALNLAATDTGGVLQQGWLRVGLFARGVGSILSDNSSQGRPHALIFPTVRIGDSADANLIIANSGQCPLRISRKMLDVVTGDVNEFTIVGMPSKTIDPVTNDALIPSGTSDTVKVRFKPLQLGSRRASIRLLTNDSTMYVPGITERGVYYADLFGSGKADLYANDVDFGSALIGGTGVDLVHKGVRLKNTQNGPIIITKVFLDGTDVADFTQETTPQWPKAPIFLNGGDEIDLGIVFGPATGQPGARTATLKMITANNDTIVSHLSGIAGTRTIVVNPTSVNFAVSSGKFFRRTVTITNTGTLPLTIKDATIAPAGTQFSMSPLARKVLDPGQTEYIEITFAPNGGNSETAQLTINSNASNGAGAVTLNGVAYKAHGVINDPSQTVYGGNNGDAGTIGMLDGDNLSLSGVAGEDAVNGMRLWQSVPNPARDEVEIRYSLAKGADVSLELYDATGRLVKVLDGGMRGVGEQRVVVDVRDLASGVYHYRLTANGTSLSKSMTIAR